MILLYNISIKTKYENKIKLLHQKLYNQNDNTLIKKTTKLLYFSKINRIQFSKTVLFDMNRNYYSLVLNIKFNF